MLTHSQIADTINNHGNITALLMTYVDTIIKARYNGPSNVFRHIPSTKYKLTILGTTVANVYISVKIEYTVSNTGSVPIYANGPFSGIEGYEVVVTEDNINSTFSIPLYIAALTMDEIKDRAKVQVETWKAHDEKVAKADRIKKLEDELAALRK